MPEFLRHNYERRSEKERDRELGPLFDSCLKNLINQAEGHSIKTINDKVAGELLSSRVEESSGIFDCKVADCHFRCRLLNDGGRLHVQVSRGAAICEQK